MKSHPSALPGWVVKSWLCEGFSARSSLSSSFLFWGSKTEHDILGRAQWVLRWSVSWISQLCTSLHSPGCCWPSLLPGQTAGLCSALSAKMPRDFSAKLLPQVPAGSTTGTHLSQVQDLALVAVDFYKVPISTFLQLVQGAWSGIPFLKHKNWLWHYALLNCQQSK